MVETLRRKRHSDRPDFDAAADRSICNAKVVVKTGAVDRPANAGYHRRARSALPVDRRRRCRRPRGLFVRRPDVRSIDAPQRASQLNIKVCVLFQTVEVREQRFDLVRVGHPGKRHFGARHDLAWRGNIGPELRARPAQTRGFHGRTVRITFNRSRLSANDAKQRWSVGSPTGNH